MKVNELQDRLESTPLFGTYPRSEFDKFSFGGDALDHPDAHAVIVGLNYRCFGPYCPQQQVEILGLHISVYADSQRCQHVVLTDFARLEETIQFALTEARKLCSHDYGRELSQAECRSRGIYHGGNCYHVRQCSKCSEIYSIDSSD